VTLLEGDTAAAIQRFSELRTNSPIENVIWSYGDPQALERWRLAELLLARGQPLDALEAARIFDRPEPAMYVLFVPRSLELRAEAARALGRTDLAASYRERLEALAAPPLSMIEASPPTGGEP
jgi:hypothetical protein